ncbi:MAG: hypothetical protein CME26_00700 [Gemmatimonadetes bacterium]|nr:hypothetical protein [Gemmatimonadota bacterium]
MGWFYLMIILHVIFGLSCAYFAYESRVKAEPWFLSGMLFGALGLIYCIFRFTHRPSNETIFVEGS